MTLKTGTPSFLAIAQPVKALRPHSGHVRTIAVGGLAKEAARLVEEARRADGIVLASPGYHGTISGS